MFSRGGVLLPRASASDARARWYYASIGRARGAPLGSSYVVEPAELKAKTRRFYALRELSPPRLRGRAARSTPRAVAPSRTRSHASRIYLNEMMKPRRARGRPRFQEKRKASGRTIQWQGGGQ